MARFLIGLLLGIALAFGYVRWGISAPGIAQLPETLRSNIVSTAVEGELYDLDKPIELRRRALEVFLRNRAKFAVEVDADFSHPFLNALYLNRVIREARILRGYWSAFDKVIGKRALREAVEKQYGTNDETALKQAMLFEKFEEETFLAQWVARHEGKVTPEGLLPLLIKLSAQPG
jgi:hypothetical protein